MARLRIRAPREHDTENKPLPRLFVATGMVRAKVRDADDIEHKIIRVEAVLHRYPLGGSPVAISQRLVRFAPDGHSNKKIQWALVLGPVPDTAIAKRFRLTIIGHDRNGAVTDAADHVDLWIGGPSRLSSAAPAFGAPSIEFPEDNYLIEGDEREYFLTFGGSELPMTGLTIGGRAPDHVEWYGEPYNFWWAEFVALGVNPGDGDHPYLATNADGTPPNYNVRLNDS